MANLMATVRDMNNTIYSFSTEFLASCDDAMLRLRTQLAEDLSLYEIITLPDYGSRVILRLHVGALTIDSLAQLDDLVCQARRCLGAEFWVSLLGSAYEPFGFYREDLGDQGTFFDEQLPDDSLRFKETCHSERISRDASVLRQELELSGDDKIWEVEVPVAVESALPEIRIVSAVASAPRNTVPRVVAGTKCRVSLMPESRVFKGLLKAYVRSCEQGLSLQSYMMKVQREQKV